MKWSIAILIVFVACLTSYSAELVLSGSYQGKNLFVQNPYNPTSKSFCTTEVYVNDRQVFDNPKTSAFRIDLSYLEINDLVIIRISYKEGCKPRVVNPQVIQKSASEYKFLASETDNNSISWSAKGESNEGGYFIEQWRPTVDWQVVDSVNVKEGNNTNYYTIRAPHNQGVNKYRIKYESPEYESYSTELVYSKSEKITFYPSIVSTTINLSDSTSYIIIDGRNKEVKKGSGHEINIENLKSGAYFLVIQNRKEKFIKR